MNGFAAHSTGRSCLQCKVGEGGVKGYATPDPTAIEFRTHAETKKNMLEYHKLEKEAKKFKDGTPQKSTAVKKCDSAFANTGVRLELDMQHLFVKP